MKGLTEGRNVHFVFDGDDVHHAAIITGIDNAETGSVYLCIFPNPTALHKFRKVSEPVLTQTPIPYSETKADGTWHWIEPA